jgi:hypothetical protein
MYNFPRSRCRLQQKTKKFNKASQKASQERLVFVIGGGQREFYYS